MKRPVFALGCARSGTTLLYSMLLASGGFAVYRKETHFYDLAPRFPNLTSPGAQQTFMKEFLHGYLGKVPGLDVEPFVRAALSECRTAHDFLPRLMDAITRAQGAERWVEATPAHLLYMNQIAAAVPDALFVHVIRDGRDCALSNSSQGWIATLPWDKARVMGVAALYWEWMVRQGRAYGQAHPERYLEVRFEELVDNPRATLARIGEFIDHRLDYDEIQQHPVHAMSNPNTSFRDERKRGEFHPVGRWKSRLSPENLRLCESLVGAYLDELGYTLALPEAAHVPDARARLMRVFYMREYATKHWLKTRTPLGRFMTRTTAWAEQPRAGERLPPTLLKNPAVSS
jgi:hypothetical protein